MSRKIIHRCITRLAYNKTQIQDYKNSTSKSDLCKPGGAPYLRISRHIISFTSIFSCSEATLLPFTKVSLTSRIIIRQLQINSLQNRNCLADSAMHFLLVRNGARYPSTHFFAQKRTFISTYGCAITHFSVASRIIARQLRINSLQNRNCLADSAIIFFVGQKWTQGIRRLSFLQKNGHLFLPMDVLLRILA